MRRWGLRGKLITVYVHRYVGGDLNEQMHNHPWKKWMSFVLRGYLIEERYVSDRFPKILVRRPRSGIETQCGDQYHKIVFAHPGTITLFIGWRRTGDWGFQSNVVYR